MIQPLSPDLRWNLPPELLATHLAAQDRRHRRIARHAGAWKQKDVAVMMQGQFCGEIEQADVAGLRQRVHAHLLGGGVENAPFVDVLCDEKRIDAALVCSAR